MKSFLFGFLLFFSESVFAGSPSLPVDPSVILRRTLGIKAPGKISFVDWSIQKSACVVQLVLSSPAREGEPLPEGPSTQVWLLKDDGTAIGKINKPHVSAISRGHAEMASILYLFPASAASDAVAVVVQVDGEFFIESLPSIP